MQSLALFFIFSSSWDRCYRQKPLPVASVLKISESRSVGIITLQMPQGGVPMVVLPLLIGCRVGILIEVHRNNVSVAIQNVFKNIFL